MNVHSWQLTYVGESKRSSSSRGAEHASNSESAIKQHVESTDHNIYPRDAQILERGVTNYYKRLFLGQRRRQRKETAPSHLLTVELKISNTTAHGLIARAVTNLDEGGQKPPKIQNRKQQIG